MHVTPYSIEVTLGDISNIGEDIENYTTKELNTVFSNTMKELAKDYERILIQEFQKVVSARSGYIGR